MQSATTVAVVIAGLFFSLACALLLEELIFGGLFRFFFAQQAAHPQRKLEANASQTKACMGHPEML
jgi:hypothetical protein